MKTNINIKDNKYLLSLIATWAVTAFVLVACYYIFHLPKKEMLAKAQQQYDESNDLVQIANKAAQPETRDQINQQCRQASEMIAQFAVPQDNMTGLVFEIGRIANELGLSEFSSRDQKTKNHLTLPENADVTEAWLELEFTTSFIKFAQFVNRLERQRPTVFIEEMELQKSSDDPRQMEVQMKLSFLVTQYPAGSIAIADVSTN